MTNFDFKGTAVFWVAMITNPELKSKIDVMMALAPAASVANVKSLIRLSAPFVNPIEVWFYFQLYKFPKLNNKSILKEFPAIDTHTSIST